MDRQGEGREFRIREAGQGQTRDGQARNCQTCGRQTRRSETGSGQACREKTGCGKTRRAQTRSSRLRGREAGSGQGSREARRGTACSGKARFLQTSFVQAGWLKARRRQAREQDGQALIPVPPSSGSVGANDHSPLPRATTPSHLHDPPSLLTSFRLYYAP